MAFNTTAASNTPDLKRLPISALHPGLPSLATQSIVAIVTLVWPYSSSTRSCALLLAEPDFRLRRRRGQVRVQFFADAAHAVATSGVGIGDVVVLRLGPSVQWLASSGEEEVVRTPGKSVEWELGYRRVLRLRAWRDGELLASLDVRSEETPERQVEEVEEDHVYNTPSKIVGRFSGEGLKMGSWASPAFLKRSRLSLDSVQDRHDIFADEDGYVEGKGRKKRKSWMNVGMWTYANRTPSPEKGEVLSTDGALSPSPEETITAQPADIMHTPESTNTATEADENEELILERPEHEPVRNNMNISPSPASREAAEQLKEEAIDQQYLQETTHPDFVGGDTEENTEVDELLSEPEDRMEGQLSFQELKAIEQDESSTEEDEPPLLVPGAMPQSQAEDYSGDTEEDSDDAFLQVTELDRSLTPTEIDSDEDEGSESEQDSTANSQAARSPLESISLEKTIKTASKEREAAEVAAEPQPSGTRAMLPPALRPSVSDESATRTPPQTPQSSAQGPDRAPPTPQLQPVTSINLPLPSPFPGTSASEPASYMDARPLPQTREATKAEAPFEPQLLSVVDEEQEPEDMKPQDNSVGVIPVIDPAIDRIQSSANGSLGDLNGMPELSEPFIFGLDGSVLSRMMQSRASDVSYEQPPAGTDIEKGGHEDVAKTTSTGPTATASESSHQTQARSPSKEPWMDVLVQDKLEEEDQQPSQVIASSDKENLETQKRRLETLSPSLKDQPDGLPETLQPAAHDSAELVQGEILGADEGPIFQDAVDDFQPQSLSFDDGYVPMIDDWDMPNLDSDPPDVSMADPDGHESLAQPLEEDREQTAVHNAEVPYPQTEVNDVAEKPLVESAPKPAKPEVTIIDLDSDSEDEDESDAERATTTKLTPRAAVNSPAPVSNDKENLQGPLKAQIKPVELETPQKPSSQALSPSKSSQQRFKTPFSDVDQMELSQGGTPRRHRLIATPASQASSIADRVSSRRRRTEVKDSECEWDSTASVSTQKPSSPPSEAADSKLLDENDNHSTAPATNFLEELPQKPAIPERSSPPVEAALLRPWENERYSSPFTSQILEELSRKPLEELSQRPFQIHGLNKETPQKLAPVSTIEGLAPSSPGVEQTARPSPESPEKFHESLPAAQESSRAPSENSQYVGESTPALENFRKVVHTFVRSSSPLPEHVERTSKTQTHSSMLIDDPSLMRALQTSQAPFSTQHQDRMTSSPPLEDEIPTFDSTQVEDTVMQNRASSPARSVSVVSTARRVADRSSPVSLDAKLEAAPSKERQSVDEDVQMEDGKTSLAKHFEHSQGLPKASASVETASRPFQESLLTPEPSQQNAQMPSSFPSNEIEQTLPPTPRLTQASHVAEGFDLTQVKAKTQDLKITEPASQHEERTDTTMGDTTLVEPPASQPRTLHRREPTSPSFSVKSVEELKSPSPTFSERVRLYESSQPEMSQRSVFSQSQGLRTSLGYFTSLSSLSQHLNSQAQVDVLAVCTRATKRPERATAGPKDYFTSFRVADESLDAEAMSVQVQVFRPWKAALPECDVGDAVLLRNFVPKSRKGKVGLISAAESAWCIFRYGKNLTQRAAAKQDHRQNQSQNKPHANGDIDGDDSQKQWDADKHEVKKGKRKSNIMDSLRPIWADTDSGLWGDLTGVVDGLDDEDASEAKGEDNANGSTETEKEEEKTEQKGTSDLEHGRYNPESGASREECHGPPVEYGDQERREARRLREWWVGGSGGGAVTKINGDL